MSKKLSVLLMAAAFAAGFSSLSYAMSCGDMDSGHSQHQQAKQVEKEAVDAGNKICPVSGEKINEKMKATYEYEGKVYNFCCAMCIDEFKKDPKKYIKKVEEEKAQP